MMLFIASLNVVIFHLVISEGNIKWFCTLFSNIYILHCNEKIVVKRFEYVIIK